MSRKRSHNENFLQTTGEVFCKITKLNERNETTSEEDNKNKSESFNAAEIVSRNMDLMNLIIRNINNVSERRNIALTCKAFNILCNSKNSFVDSFKTKIETRHWINYFVEEPLFMVFDDILIINISHFSRSVTKKLEIFGKKIKMHRHKIRTLKIKNLPSGYFDYFKKLNCFENIRTIYFDVLKFKYIPMAIFEEWPSLRPNTLIFGNVINNDFDYRDSNRAIYNNEKYTFPKCIRNIHLLCETENVDWMVNALKNFQNYELESLVLMENFTEYLSGLTMISINSIIHFFKKVKFLICKCFPSSLNEYFAQILSDFIISDNFVLIFDMNFNVSKCNFDVWIDQDHSLEGNNDITNSELYENVSINGRYLSIHNVKVYRSDILIKYKLTDIEIMSLKEGFSKMHNLTTLELDLDLISSSSHTISLFNGLGKNLKNIKIYNSGNLKLNDLIMLTKSCPNIENLCLEDLKSNNITIKKIISMFKNLKGLEIQFSFEYNIKNIIYDLIKMDDIKKQYLLDWPQIYLLNIFFPMPDADERELLIMVEKETPRKSGKFLIIPFIRKYNMIWQVIIQKNTNYISHFCNIFNSQYIF